MKTIYKYELDSMINKIELPANYQILRIDLQKGNPNPQMWCLVNKEMPLVERTIAIYGTGFKIEAKTENLHYINTFFEDNMVWHAFEVIYI